MTKFDHLQQKLLSEPKCWLVTGVAGFIGSNILEVLLKLNQNVIGVDNFSTGYHANLDDVSQSVTPEQWSRFTLLQGDIVDSDVCRAACEGVDYVLHQAALGSVPHSIDDPGHANSSNVTGFLNMLLAARDASVSSFTYASSSAVYGNHVGLSVEEKLGEILSPYALTKWIDECYAEIFAKTYNFYSIGLRYFNIFGQRQDPAGAYAAVIPKWASVMMKNQPIYIYGDGSTSRDFCFVEDVVQANLLAATATQECKRQVYNVATGCMIKLLDLCYLLKQALENYGVYYAQEPIYASERRGDIKHSCANISKIENYLGYDAQYSVREGIEKMIPWYLDRSTYQGTQGRCE